MKALIRWMGVLVVPPLTFLLVRQVVGGICNGITIAIGCGPVLQAILAVASCAFAMALLVLISERIAPKGKTLVAFIWGCIIMLPMAFALIGMLCSGGEDSNGGSSVILSVGVLFGGTIGLIAAWRKRSRIRVDSQSDQTKSRR